MRLKQHFEVYFLEEADRFLAGLDEKSRNKVLYNVLKSSMDNDPWLFKKLASDIWEFRTRYGGMQYRLLAFWDLRREQQALVLATHGIVKKKSRVPAKEIERAMRIRKKYFELSNDERKKDASL